jgi:hypothetical protein
MFLLMTLLFAAPFVNAQTPAPPDTITFTNGDTLTGHVVQATGSTVTFHNDALGDVTVNWKNVKELHTTSALAVLRKGVTLSRRAARATVPVSPITKQEQTLLVAPSPGAAPETISLADVAVVVERTEFEKATTRNADLLHDWKGTVTLGASLVAATQDSQTYTSHIDMVRAEPAENWLAPRDRTSLSFSNAYGKINEPLAAPIKTSIYHADAERDEYFNHHLFVFGQAAFDHNSTQGLDLQQSYSGGLGWTVIDSPNETLDLKASGSYLRQEFQAGSSQDLSGSVVGERFRRHFRHDMILDQRLTYTPAWNVTRAWSALGGVSFTVPFYKNFGVSTSVTDSFLNDPLPGFRRNSFQFTAGITLTLAH